MTSAAPWEVVLLGSHADLVAQPSDAAWGRTRAAAPNEAEIGNADLTIALDPELSSAHVSKVDVVWHPEAASAGNGTRVVARPWPVADDLFDLMPSARADACLVIGPASADADRVVARLREARLEAQFAARATRELLAETRIVVSLTPGPPAETFAILAAGRLLVAPADTPRCGLQAWIDHVTFSNEDELVELVHALAAYPDSWRPIQAFGRRSAEPQRASKAIGRLVRRMQAGA